MRSDPTGFSWNRAIVCDADGNEYPELTPKYISSGSYTIPNSYSHKMIDNISSKTGTNKGNAALGVGDSIIGSGTSTVVSKITKPIDYLFSTPKISRVSGAVGKVGILNTLSLGLNIRDNVVHYNTWDASGRTIIDVAGFAATIGFAALTAPLWAPTMDGFLVGTVGVGIGVNVATGAMKDKWLGRKKE